MQDINRYLITSISDYVSCIKKIKIKANGPLWFRGHSKASYQLLPGIFRDPFVLHDIDGKPYKPKSDEIVFSYKGGHKGFNQKRLMSLFKDIYLGEKDRLYRPKNDFEWLCLMQHYGVPTLLLDWSTNAFTALYFALDGTRSKPRLNKPIKNHNIPDILTESEFDGAVIYAINPAKINEYTVVSSNSKPCSSIINISKMTKEMISNIIYPDIYNEHLFAPAACVASKKFDIRILAQQGVFMIFSIVRCHIEYIKDLGKHIYKIFIPKSVLGEMNFDLNNLGFNTKIFYPDRDPESIIAKNRLNAPVKEMLEDEETYVKNILK